MLVVVNGVDLTPHISEKSYKMNAESNYESWKDGNNREHRIYSDDKIKGEFTVALFGINGMYLQEFLDNWNAAVNNHVLTVGVFVQNTNSFEVIEAYYEFEGGFHREMINGEYCDKIKVKIQER